MERSKPNPGATEYSFSNRIREAQKLRDSGLLTERGTLLITSIEACLALVKGEAGLRNSEAEKAAKFLTRNWEKLPTVTRYLIKKSFAMGEAPIGKK